MKQELPPKAKLRINKRSPELPQEKKLSNIELEPDKVYRLDFDDKEAIWEESSGENHGTAHMEQVVVGRGKNILDAPAGGACLVVAFEDKKDKLGAVLHVTSLDSNYKRYTDHLLKDVSFSPNSEIHCCVDLVAPELPPEETVINAEDYKRQVTDWLKEVVDYFRSKGFNNIKLVTKGTGKDVTLYTDTGRVVALDENGEKLRAEGVEILQAKEAKPTSIELDQERVQRRKLLGTWVRNMYAIPAIGRPIVLIRYDIPTIVNALTDEKEKELLALKESMHTETIIESLNRVLGIENINATPEEEMAAELQVRMEKALEEAEQDLEGLDIQRIEAHMRSIGFKKIPKFIVINRKNVDRLEYRLRPYLTAQKGRIEKENNGAVLYLKDAKFIYVIRDRDEEKTNGKIYTQSVIIHEITHGLREIKKILPTFFEEAEAELEAGEYVEANFQPKDRPHIVEFMKKKSKSGKNKKVVTITRGSGKSQLVFDLPVHSLYTKKDKDIGFGDFFWGVPVIASQGMRLLCEEIPELRSALRRSRTEESAIEDIKKLVDEFHPGLYGKLSKLKYTEKGFAQGQQLIRESIKLHE